MVIALAVIIAYAPSIGGTFLSDDYDWVTTAEENLQANQVFAPLTHSSGGNFYRPIQMLSFTLDVAIAGRNPVWFHLHHLALFVALSLAVMWLVQELFRRRSIAVGAGLVFAVYPAHHEVVTWLAGRADIYAALFMVVASATAIRFVRHGHWRWLVASGSSGLLALMSKESALVLPGVLVLVLGTLKLTDRNIPWRRLVLAFLPSVIALIAILGIRSAVLTDAIGGYRLGGEATGLNIRPRTLTAPLTSAGMLVNVSWLRHVVGDWPIVDWYLDHYMRLRLFVPIFVGLLGLILASIAGWKRWWPILAFGVAWCGLTFIPVIGLSNAIGSNLEGSRLFFTPSIGYALLFASAMILIGDVFRRRTVRLAMLGIVVLGFAGLAMFNGQPWTNASREVEEINAKLADNQTELLPSTMTDVIVIGLPAKTYGAYQFMGKHAIRGVVKHLAGEAVDVYVAGNARYTDSPFCSTAPHEVIVLRWSEAERTWSRDRRHEDRLAIAPATESKTWGLNDWGIINMQPAESDGAYRLIDGKSGLLLQGLEAIPGSAYRKLDVTLSSFDVGDSFGSRRGTLAWSADESFTSLNQVSYTIPTGATSYSIPLCEYMNWMLAEDIRSLRLRPVQAGMFTTTSVTLAPGL